MPIDIGEPAASSNGLIELYAVGAVLVIAFALVALISWAKWGGLDSDEKHDIGDVRDRLQRFSGPRLTIRGDTDDLSRWRDEIERLPSGEAAGLRSADDAFADVRQAWQSRTPDVPRLATWLGYEAVVLGLFAGVVLVSASTIEEILTTGDSSPGYYVSRAVELSGDAIGTPIGAFPGQEFVWALVLTVVVTGYDLLYSHPVAIAALLATSALAIVLLDRASDGEGADPLYPDRRRTVARVVGAGLAIYLSGAGPAGVLGAVGYPEAGAAVGGGAAVVVALAAVGFGGRDLATRLRTVLRPHRDAEAVAASLADADRRAARLATTLERRGITLSRTRTQGFAPRNRVRTAAYLVARRTAALLGLVTVPVLMGYVGQALLDGHLFETVGIVAAAPLRTQVALGVIGLVTIGALTRPDAEDWRELSDAVARALSERAVRAVLATTIGPVAAAIGVAGYLLVFRVPILYAVAAGLIGGVLIRYAYFAWRWVRTRAIRDRDPSPPPYIRIEHGSVEMPDGTTLWILKLNRHSLAWPDRDALLEQGMADLEAICAGESPDPSIMQSYHRELGDAGVTDGQSFLQRRTTLAKRSLEEAIGGQRERVGAVDERLEDVFDQRIVDRARQDLRREGRLSVGERYYRLHGD